MLAPLPHLLRMCAASASPGATAEARRCGHHAGVRGNSRHPDACATRGALSVLGAAPPSRRTYRRPSQAQDCICGWNHRHCLAESPSIDLAVCYTRLLSKAAGKKGPQVAVDRRNALKATHVGATQTSGGTGHPSVLRASESGGGGPGHRGAASYHTMSTHRASSPAHGIKRQVQAVRKEKSPSIWTVYLDLDTCLTAAAAAQGRREMRGRQQQAEGHPRARMTKSKLCCFRRVDAGAALSKQKVEFDKKCRKQVEQWAVMYI